MALFSSWPQPFTLGGTPHVWAGPRDVIETGPAWPSGCDLPTPRRGAREEDRMSITANHVHVKTPDPKTAAQFYIDTLGATMIGEAGTNGDRVNLHGLQLNITTLIPTQHREQRYGIKLL